MLLLVAVFLVGGVTVLPEIRSVARFLTSVGVSGNLREVLPQRLYRSSETSMSSSDWVDSDLLK